jgi:hypothetical protein
MSPVANLCRLCFPTQALYLNNIRTRRSIRHIDRERIGLRFPVKRTRRNATSAAIEEREFAPSVRCRQTSDNQQIAAYHSAYRSRMRKNIVLHYRRRRQTSLNAGRIQCIDIEVRPHAPAGFLVRLFVERTEFVGIAVEP